MKCDEVADYDTAPSAKPKLDSSLYGRGLAKRTKGDSEGAERDIAAAKSINASIADEFAGYGVRVSRLTSPALRLYGRAP